jgi:signal transduction histidine kinase
MSQGGIRVFELPSQNHSNKDFRSGDKCPNTYTVLCPLLRAPRTSEARFPPSRSELSAAPDEMLRMQECERQRIALDLHDGLGQTLTMVKLELMQAASLLGDNASMTSDAQASLQRLKSRVHEAFDELRRTVMQLRPSMLDDLGIVPTLSWFFREFEASAGASIKLEKDIRTQESEVPALLKVVIFRILQEAVSNVVKHAEAHRIRVSLTRSGDILQFSVADDGRGFDPAEAGIYRRNGGGIAGIISRVQSSKGLCAIDSAVGQGTRISICWAVD